MGLVSDANHRIAKNGNKYGSFIIEDYSGKLNLMLFSEDYMRFSSILQMGTTVYLSGYYRQRYNGEFEFKITSVNLAESVKKIFTKKLSVSLPAADVTEDMIQFVQKNLKTHKGNSTLYFNLNDVVSNLKVELFTGAKGFEMNSELVDFLTAQSDWNIKVECNNS
ncbi:MAG: OB-fold nucleic acid binding domain-containing protein [Niabella sp.]